MKILIVEDDPFVADDLQDKLQQLNYRVTAIAESYEEAFSAIRLEKPDLVLLDIELIGELTGIDLGEKLSSIGISFIYLSSIQDFTTYSLAKSTAPLKNLSKPIDLLNLRNALLDIDLSSNIESTSKRLLYFVTNKDGVKIRIELESIEYLEAARSYCDIYFTDGSKSTLSSAMGNVAKKMDFQDLIPISRSHQINLKKIKQIRGNEIEMTSGKFLKVSDSFKESFNRHLSIL